MISSRIIPVSEAATRHESADSSGTEEIPGQLLFASLAENAYLRAESLISAGRRGGGQPPHALALADEIAGLGNELVHCDPTGLQRIQTAIESFITKIDDLEQRSARAQSTIDGLASGEIGIGETFGPATGAGPSIAIHPSLGSPAEPVGSAPPSAGRTPLATARPTADHLNRQWLANVLTAVAVVAVVLIVLAVLGTIG